MSELLKGVGILAILCAGAWIYIILSAVGYAASNYVTAIGALAMLPPLGVIGVGLLFIAAGVALDRLREIRDAARDALYHLRKLSKDAP